MADVNVTFVAEDESELDATLPDAFTRAQAIQALINERFITPQPNVDFALTVKGGALIQDGQTMAQSGVKNGDRIRVAATHRAGASDRSSFVHQERMQSDYESMQRLTGTMITWNPMTAVDPPRTYPTRYRVTFHIKAPTVDGTRDEHRLLIDISNLRYPEMAPDVRFETPIIKHPHVYHDNSNRVCLGGFPIGESLANLCIRLARLWQFDPALFNASSIACRDCWNWYQANRSSFPMDRQTLPELKEITSSTSGFRTTGRRISSS